MAQFVRCNFQLLRWVPDAVRGEFLNVGIVLTEAAPGGRTMVRFTPSWRRVFAVDGSCEPKFLQELAEELAQRLVQVEQDSDRRALLTVARSSFSTGLQITDPRACLAETMESEMVRLMRMYVDPRQTKRRAKTEVLSGRSGLAMEMRHAFESAGVWALMRRGIAAAEYTRAGDRLRIDCGYRVEGDRAKTVHMLHVVSVGNDAEAAKALAFSAAELRDGVRLRERAALRLTAVVEPKSDVASAETWRFAVESMQAAGVAVQTRLALRELAMTARRELRVQ